MLSSFSEDIAIFQNSINTAWNIPSWARFITVTCIGAGGGGSGGESAALNTSAAAGAGGSSGCVTTAIFPTTLLPKTLYITTGIGGVGGAAASVGGIGSNTIVSLSSNNADNRYMLCHASGGGNGGIRVLTQRAPGGTSTNIFTTLIYSSVAIGYTALNGSTGGTGGYLGGLGDNVYFLNSSYLTTSLVTGGAGGSGSSASGYNQGGSVISSGILSTVSGGGGPGSGGGAQASPFTNGLNGNFSFRPLCGTGGSGGGGNSDPGGNGGNGALGCGGGGGGAGTTGGSGGNGGNGLVTITCW